jgi:hypothetical protein
MKLILSMCILLALSTACKKTYVCECITYTTVHYGQSEQETFKKIADYAYTIKPKKVSEAKNACINDHYVEPEKDVYTVCDLK